MTGYGITIILESSQVVPGLLWMTLQAKPEMAVCSRKRAMRAMEALVATVPHNRVPSLRIAQILDILMLVKI